MGLIEIARKIKINGSWIFDVVRERKRVFDTVEPKVLADSRTLVLAPHSDDEWIGCSQIIQGNSEVLICNMDMPGGDSAALHSVRHREMRSLAARFNRRLETVAHDKRAADLSRIVKSYSPEVVFLPFFTDWHEEHIAVMKILQSVADSLGDIKIGMYPVSLPLLPSCITHYRPLPKRDFNFKWTTFKSIYRTQAQALPWRRFAAHERINGACVKEFAAEVYCVMPVAQWLHCLKSKTLSEQQKAVLKANLNNISRVRELLALYAVTNEARAIGPCVSGSGTSPA